MRSETEGNGPQSGPRHGSEPCPMVALAESLPANEMGYPAERPFFDRLTRLRVHMEAAYLKTASLRGVNEALVARIWERQLVRRDALITDTGVPLQVVYPGRRSHDGGPDFRHAIIATADASLWRGDVEIHVRASDWRGHGHHRDPRYNSTVLHTVLHGDLPGGAFLESGALLPTLALEDCLSASLESLCRETPPAAANPWPCRRALAALRARGLEKLLDSAGEARFLAKAASFEAGLACQEPGQGHYNIDTRLRAHHRCRDLACQEPGQGHYEVDTRLRAHHRCRDLACQEPAQVLYEGVMAALGYAHNQAPFREVARRLPLSVLEGMAAGKGPERQLDVLQVPLSSTTPTLLSTSAARERQLDVLQVPLSSTTPTLSSTSAAKERQLEVLCALLLGAAGLLPSQRRPPLPSPFADAAFVFGLEEAWQGMGSTYDPLPWRWAGVRPENLPPRRLAGMAHLLARHGEEGLLEALLRCVSAGPPLAALAALESALTAPAEGFWLNRYDFGLPTPRRVGALIGRGRAREIMVNVALPFFYAYAQATAKPCLAERTLNLYGLCPPLSENEITREMTGLLLAGARGIGRSARRQQGLQRPSHLPATVGTLSKIERSAQRQQDIQRPSHLPATVGTLSKIGRSARRQQGLIHLYKSFCMERRCEACPLGGQG